MSRARRNQFLMLSTATMVAAAVSTTQPAGAAVVLSENFDNVYVSSNSATQNVCINSTCSTIPAGLTAGTTANSNSGPAPAGASTAPDTANIRRGDNTINLSTGVNGFSSAFAATTANRFLVLGDDTNTIADGSLNGGLSFARIPFSLAAGDAAATISFAWAFGGADNNPAADDQFTVRVLNAAGVPLFTALSRSSSSGYGHGVANVLWGPGDSFAAGAYRLEFLLSEVSDGTSGAFAQSAAGIDSIAIVTTAVPEPATAGILLAGLVAIAGARRRPRSA